LTTPIFLTNLTRHTEIGANSYFLQCGDTNIVLDCGMHPKEEGLQAAPNLGLVRGERIDAIIVTHAHQDHIGTLPVLMRQHPESKVFMTYATSRLGEAMLHNSVNVMTRQREELGTVDFPLFTHRELDGMVGRWDYVPLRQTFGMDGERRQRDSEDFTAELLDAGHILGSTGAVLRSGGRTIFYTGDVNFRDQTLSRGAKFPEEFIDVLIIETTRGDNPTPEGFTRKAEEKRFIAAIKEAFDRGGSVLIPVFAIGKTQEVLTIIYEMKRDGDLAPSTPIYIGGLSAKMTMIHDELSRATPRRYEGLELLDMVAPYVLGGKEAQHASPGHGKIFAISSGMMTEKTLSNVFARKFLEEEKHSVFFVGYAAPDSPGGVLRAAEKGAQVVLDKSQPPLTLNATVEKFDFSAHSTREDLLAYILRVNAPATVLVHGDPSAIEWFRSQLAEKAPKMRVVVPPPGEKVEL
jgi:Cft2 family RNA processing exonuclease